MEYRSRLIFCLFLITANNKVTSGQSEGISDQSTGNTTDTIILEGNNDTSAELPGVPDSHEAMNNRDTNKAEKHKTKRSYEFLLGLINNNSKYELTKKEPAPKFQEVTKEWDIEPGNELLQLLLKIASHPDQWYKVHKLLRKLDIDLQRSKKLVHKTYSRDGELLKNENTDWQMGGNHEKTLRSQNKYHSEDQRFTGKSQPNYPYQKPNTWGMYKDTKLPSESADSDIDELNLKMTKYAGRVEYSPEDKAAFRKQFTYHKVTGKPLYIDKPSKAYIAVSIIAPKIDAKIRNGAELEKQLKKLKPWEHQQQRDSF